MHLGNAHTHGLVEAVPLDADSFSKAPMYFKAEVDSAAGEWSQHHAKRMIDTREKVQAAPVCLCGFALDTARACCWCWIALSRRTACMVATTRVVLVHACSGSV